MAPEHVVLIRHSSASSGAMFQSLRHFAPLRIRPFCTTLSRSRSDSETNSPIHCEPGLPALRCIPHLGMHAAENAGVNLELATEQRKLVQLVARALHENVMLSFRPM